ncbi:hypothetical protein Pori4_00057 [Pseudomonas phage vB_PpuM-Pori-4]
MAKGKTVKFYLATSYELHASAELYVDWIQNHTDTQLKNTARWIWDENDTDHVAQKAKMDFEDIDKADALIAFWPFGKGTSAEIAYAYAKGLQIIMYIPEDFYDEGKIACMPVGLGIPLEYAEWHTGDGGPDESSEPWASARYHPCHYSKKLLPTEPVIVHNLKGLSFALTLLTKRQ